MNLVLIAQLKNPKFYLLIFLDIVLFAVSLFMAHLVRHESGFQNDHLWWLAGLLAWMIPLKSIVFSLIGLYGGMWRFTSLRDLRLLATACLLSTMLVLLVFMALPRFEGHSLGIFFIDGILTFVLTGGLRLGIRYYFAIQEKTVTPKRSAHPRHATKVLIVGAGRAGEKILREILENKMLNYKVLGFIDDDPAKKGLSIHGVRVLGDVSGLADIAARLDIEQIFIALPSADGKTTRRIVDACLATGISHKILPGIGELIDGRVSTKMLRDINYEDLLGRSGRLDNRGIRDYDGWVVLVTSCGSISSELRQIVKYQPAEAHFIRYPENSICLRSDEPQRALYEQLQTVLGRVWIVTS